MNKLIDVSLRNFLRMLSKTVFTKKFKQFFIEIERFWKNERRVETYNVAIQDTHSLISAIDAPTPPEL